MDVYRSEGERTVTRRVSGPSLFGALGYEFGDQLRVPSQYEETHFVWGSHEAGVRALALAVLGNCLGETDSLQEGGSSIAAALHEAFATEVIAQCDPDQGLNLTWESVMHWVDGQLNGGEPSVLVRLCQGVHGFESRLSEALGRDPYDDRRRHVDPDLWSHWNLEGLLHTAIARRTFPFENLPRLMGSLMDIKFKLYCLFEADLPAYAIAIEHYQLSTKDPGSTPHALAIRLSSEATMIVKVRSIWESVMNAVFAAEGLNRPPAIKGVDTDGFSFGSKSKYFYRFIESRPTWSGLGGFQHLIEALDEDRTPEVHQFSQLRADFAEGKYRPLNRILRPLNTMLFYFWDHLSAVLFFNVGPTYDVAAGTGVHVDLTGSPADEVGQ